ncbi:flagellar basal body-associated protein FliL [Alkalihalobacillus pseudalcaliphilus]|uniref:flagellar basal body-associated protein FliL n=1 Tax=Alkalihalobacillus pseudalcaliphilus TaxID=79884 RepID=UPI00064D9D30|nr:flagellar basal body-associated protein FliL [Alkalihalobacillus pseudalcaliphilus]KMK77224.1 flagellar basal body-associated protein FliL [Alkalihalobacillus pseudalcaliphilus]
MKKNKMFQITLILMLTFSLVGVAVIIFLNQSGQFARADNNQSSIDDIIEMSFETEQIVTNLKSNDYIRVSFFIQGDSKDTLTEIEKRDFQLNHLILSLLSEKTSSELSGRDGMRAIEAQLKEEINTLLDSGEVQNVYTTSWVIQ